MTPRTQTNFKTGILFSFTIAFIIIVFPGCSGNEIQYGSNPKAGKYYNVRGIKIYCEIYGKGKPLLMIHGNAGSIESFSENIPYFSKNYKVIVADSRAQGKTIDRADSLSFEMMADDEAALLDALHIDSAYVIGWSDGGINALLLAMRHPEKVIKLAATGANLWVDSTAFVPSLWNESKEHYEKERGQQHVTDEDRNNWKIFLLDWFQPNISLPSLHSVQCPSLIMCGDNDIITLSHTKLIAENIQNAKLWVVPNSGHATLRDQKDKFNKAVDHFFNRPDNSIIQ
ncbi:MAG: alpha/beta hydrolase [Ginsengibacter sp.]